MTINIKRLLDTVGHRILREDTAQSIASTIKQQIMALDFWALGAWGSNTFRVVTKGMNSSLDGIQTESGLDWKVKGSKFRGNVRVCLNPATDMYTVYFYTTRAYTLKIVKTVEEIYGDQLVEVLDDVIGK